MKNPFRPGPVPVYDPTKYAMELADRYYDSRQQLLENRLERLRLIAKASNIVNLSDYRTRRTTHERY